MKNILSITTLGSLLLLMSCGQSTKKYSDMIEGKLKKESISIAPKISGRILKIYVKEGQLVKAGDTLAEIDIPEIEAKSMQTEGAFMSAKAQNEMAQTGATKFERNQIEAKYEAAKSQFVLAEKSYKRIKSLYKDSLLAAQKYDEVEDKYNAAKAQLDAVNAQLKDVEYGVRQEKKDMTMGDVKRAEGALKEVASAMREKYIIAPTEMFVETITLREGELALAGYNLFTGYENNSVYFRVTVKEAEIKAFKLNQSYEVKIPYLDDKSVQAKLVAIKEMGSYAKKTASYAMYELGEAVYELKLTPANPQEISAEVPLNMTVMISKSVK